MDDFIQRQGPAFLAHILRRLADELIRGAALWYPEAGVTAPPRTASTLLALDTHAALGVTEIAAMIGQSHPLVIGWIRQLTALGFVETTSDPKDGRRSVIRLTGAGGGEVRRLRDALVVVEAVSRQLLAAAAGGDMFAGLWRMDAATRALSFADRLRAAAAASAAP